MRFERLSVVGCLLSVLVTAAVASANEPTPAAPSIVASKDVTGTGKRADPFVFDASTKCLLRLQGGADDLSWDLSDCPAETEAIGPVLVFSLSQPGEFVAWVNWTGGRAKSWFVIKSGTDPPKPVDNITSRVKAALAGNPQDAVKLSAVMDSLVDAIPTIKTTGEFAAKMSAGLNAVGWVPEKHKDLSTLAGELFGFDADKDHILTTADKAGIVASLKALSDACKAVK